MDARSSVHSPQYAVYVLVSAFLNTLKFFWGEKDYRLRKKTRWLAANDKFPILVLITYTYDRFN